MQEESTHYVEENKVMSFVTSRKYIIFLDEVISDTAYYRNAIYTLRTASSADTIEIMFETGGGNCGASSAISSAVMASTAWVIGNLSGMCASAGSTIALKCDEWVVGDDLVFMCHTGSYGVYDSVDRVKVQVDFMNEHNNDTMHRDYEGFLSEDEINNLLENGREYWFNATEMGVRLNHLGNFRKEKKARIKKEKEDELTKSIRKDEDFVIGTLMLTEEQQKNYRLVRELIDMSDCK
jgi:ATP-dependent protease ClpP protease subunit